MFDQAGLDPKKLHDPNARYPVAGLTKLWRLAVRTTADPAIGLKAARFLAPTTLHALGYSWMASETLKEALDRGVRYYRIVSSGIEATLEEDTDVYRFIITVPEIPPVADEAIDAGMAIIVLACRRSYGKDFSPLRVTLQRKPPPDREVYDQLFRAPLEFAARENALLFDKIKVNTPLSTANAELARANDRVIRDYLARFDRGSVKLHVEAKLVEQLSSGRVTQASIARALNLSSRTLQRKLKEEGTTYKELLDDTRRELASQYVKQS
ncbi:MAG: AraC family transcriptional regulator ligand-binding domain-containing protein, partial [Acidiferrobacterales bacterium]